jgi:hypothetical protein
MSLYGPWTAASLEVLRAFALSCQRVERLQREPGDDDRSRAFHREIHANLALLKALELER